MSSAGPKKKRRKDRLIGLNLAGKYEIIKKIGEGGMGSVYIANQNNLDRKVAIKVLLRKLAEDEVAVKRFEQEAKAISKMQHPNTVTIYEYGRTDEEDDDRLYIVMEYLSGRTLTQELRKEGVLTGPRAAKIIRQVCSSLADAHQAGIIHRDLKPDNIFLTQVGNDADWVKVLDFGVAKLADAEGAGTLTQTGMIFGTPKYMSPEQAEGKPIDYRTDIYALGVVLFELLVGRPPFIADTPVGLLLKHISEPAPRPSEARADVHVDPRMEALVLRALEKNPDRRFQTVGEFAEELERFERSASGPVHTVPGNLPAQGRPGYPTEVVPPAGGPVTPDGLMPPEHVPSGLSLGAEVGTQAHAPRTAARTAAQAPHEPATLGQPMRVEGLTAPTPRQGGYETLGGIGGEISGPLLARKKSKTPMYMVAALGIFVVAGGLATYAISARTPTSVEAKPIAPNLVTPAIDEPAPDGKGLAGLEGNGSGSQAPDTVEPKTDRNPSATRKTPRTRPRTGRTTPPPPPPVVVSKTAPIHFESSPPKAKVIELSSNKELGITPFTKTLPKDEVVRVRFVRKGYQSADQLVNVSGERIVRATLEKKAVASTRPPRERIKPPPRVVPPPKRDDPPPSDGKIGEKLGDLK